MRLVPDFEMLVMLAVMNEMAELSDPEARDPKDEIVATPVTNHHFGGPCFFNRLGRRYAWIRAFRDKDGRTIPDRVVVCFGYREVPQLWKIEFNRNNMKHTHVSHETESHKIAARMVIDFLLNDVLPEQLFNGDYHYYEPELN